MKATLKYVKDGAGYSNLIKDDPAFQNLQPSRFFKEEKSLNRAVGDIVADCTFDTSDLDDIVEGGLGRNKGFCFGIVTYEPPIGLSECTSTPSEVTFETVFDFELDANEDPDQLRRRRRRRKRRATRTRSKRQSTEYSWDFFDRQTTSSKYVDDVLKEAEGEFSAADKTVANQKLMSLDQVQICRNSDDYERLTMPRVTVNDELPEADVAKVFTTEECEDYYKGEDVAANLNESGGGGSGSSGGGGKSGSNRKPAGDNMLVMAALGLVAVASAVINGLR